jgi:hypothetical protein
VIHQLDVKNVFLHDTLTETVYCSQPTGFVNAARPDLFCWLNRSLYGLNQASRAWYSRFASYLASIGFAEAKSDTSLFIYQCGDDTVYLLLYVDDIVLTASTANLLQRTIAALQREFVMKDLGPLQHFLGITVERRPQGLFLHQRQYAIDILERASMSNCKPCSSSVDSQVKLSENDGPPIIDVMSYRSLTDAIQYVTFYRSDITYVVQQVWCICTPRGSPISPLSSGSCATSATPSTTTFYSDPPPPRRRSSWCTPTLTGLAIPSVGPLPAMPCSWAQISFFGPPSGSPLSPAPTQRSSTALWPIVWQRPPGCASFSTNSTDPSSTPASSTATTSTRSTSPPISCSISARSTCRSTCTFVRERVTAIGIRVLSVPTTLQFADIFTKGLSLSVFADFRFSLNICTG